MPEHISCSSAVDAGLLYALLLDLHILDTYSVHISLSPTIMIGSSDRQDSSYMPAA